MDAEAGVVLGDVGQPIYWHAPRNRTIVSLPDSRDLWDVLWENRHIITGFAHSHPGSGRPCPSPTDISTFAAIEVGLGIRLDWWITTSDGIAIVQWDGPHKHAYRTRTYKSMPKPSWVEALRELSDGVV